MLPIDYLLKPQRKYMGEDHHKLIIEKQHKIFIQDRKGISCAQKRQNDKINRNRNEIDLGIGDPVYYKIHMREGKLSLRLIT